MEKKISTCYQNFFLKAADRANALFAEGENLREKLKVFETQTSTSRDILRDIERQLKETSLQLKSKELALKAANESVTSLEKLILTSDQQLSSLQIRFQVVSTARAAVSNTFWLVIYDLVNILLQNDDRRMKRALNSPYKFKV